MTSKTSLSVHGARGGHGTTLIAGALAVIVNLPLRTYDPIATRWIWPEICTPMFPSEPHVLDAGVMSMARRPAGVCTETIAVLRGPCSLGAVTLARWVHQIDHLVVLREPGRPLRREDIEAAIAIPVVAEVAVTPRVARLADAGLLHERVADLDEFAELRSWALGRWPRIIAGAS